MAKAAMIVSVIAKMEVALVLDVLGEPEVGVR
jgi:hypothetical protein